MEEQLEHIERCVITLIVMAGINMGLLVVGVGLGILLLISGHNARGTLVSLMSSIQLLFRECLKTLDQSAALTNMTRLLQQSANQTMKRVEEVTPTLTEKVEELPRKTAEVVVDKLKSGDSGVLRG